MMRARCFAKRQDLQKRLIRICVCKRSVYFLRISFDIDGRQNAAVYRHQMRCELDFHVPSSELRKLLIKLTKMAVGSPNSIGVIAFTQLSMQ